MDQLETWPTIYHLTTPTVPSSTLPEGRPLTNPESTTLDAQPWCVFILRHQRVPFLGFPDSSVGKESACNAGDPGSIPGSGRSAGEGIGYPLQYSWAFLVAQLVKNLPAMQESSNQPWVQSLSWEDPLEKGKSTQPTPEFWPGEFHELYSPWGHKESDMTEWLSLQRVQVKYFSCSNLPFPLLLVGKQCLAPEVVSMHFIPAAN